jgi:hypothetical protein
VPKFTRHIFIWLNQLYPAILAAAAIRLGKAISGGCSRSSLRSAASSWRAPNNSRLDQRELVRHRTS